MMRAPILKSAIAGFSLMFFAPLAIAQDGTGAATEQTQALNIPAGPMADALDALVQQSGIQLIYRDADVAGITTAGVRGETTVDAALDVLLQGTELVVTRDATGAMAIGTPNSLADTGADAGPFAEGSASANVAAARRAGVEEIIVTGQKKEERLQDVPIAISAFSAEDLNAYKIEGGFDLLKAIPNVSFTKTNFTGYNFQIRGVGTQSISATSDPGVAVSFNGTAIIQNRLFEQEYLDIERVEVLRGPQGTLYGRNSTGGVVNVISARPDLNAFSTQLKSEVGNYNTRRGSAVINIPVVEGMLGLRVAGAYTSRDGYDFNTITGNSINGRDLWTGRVTLGFQPTDWMRGSLIWEHFNEDDNRSRTGKQLCHRDDGPTHVGAQPTSDPNFPRYDLLLPAVFSTGCKAGSLYDDAAFGTPNGLAINFVLGMLALSDVFHIGFDENGQPTAPIRFQDPYDGQMQSRDLRTIASFRDPVYRAEADLLNLNLEFDLGRGLSLHSQTAYVDDQTYSFQDYNRFNTVPIFTDTSSLLWEPDPFNQPGVMEPSPFRHLAPGGQFCDPQLGCSNTIAGFDIASASAEQFSQELRLQSAWDGPFNFSFGANYTTFDVLADYYVMYNLLTAYAMMPPFNTGRGSGDISQCFASGFTAEGPAVPTDAPNSACPYIDPNPVDQIDGNGHNYFRSKNPYKLNSYAAFGEAYWQFNDAGKLTVGLRYTRDKKRFTPVPSQVLLAPTTLAGGYVSHGYPELPDIVQTWGEMSGRIGVDWKMDAAFTDETLLYAFFSRGYKGGGANPPSPGFAVWDDLLSRGVITDDERNVYQNFLAGGADGFLVLNAVEYGPTFEPEFVNAFEVGAKNTLFGGAMVLNATAFFYDYKDYQVSQIRDRTAVNENFDTTVWGAELEAVFAPTVDFQVVANLGLLKTRVDDGEQSIDIMNRTQSNSDYIVVKPWVQLPSNCVVPTDVAEYRLATEGAVQYFRLCGGYNGLGSQRAIDPATGEQYDPANYPELNGGAGLLADLGGNELPNSPRLTANLGAQYGIDMFKHEWRATLRGDVYWQDESYHRVYNFEPYDRLKSWHNVNLAIRMEHPRSALAMELYVKNVLNDTPITGAFLNSDDTGLTTNVFTLDPRLVGFSISKTF
ncbi:TonB-dependent receptor [Flagellatimonas centrodinii]|uniref:TonB-dependent receptor domain-containing protein n=1 Tax=Flagellatimonas centrodinii TaxID=2806210 RepID=UPI001FF0035C|nr:TonB-dependent receptor [Flagellatimonas centrodinii]ULQ48076.1 TonB-dependent receptor [Flagellatimonas centrodinii]